MCNYSIKNDDDDNRICMVSLVVNGLKTKRKTNKMNERKKLQKCDVTQN